MIFRDFLVISAAFAQQYIEGTMQEGTICALLLVSRYQIPVRNQVTLVCCYYAL